MFTSASEFGILIWRSVGICSVLELASIGLLRNYNAEVRVMALGQNMCVRDASHTHQSSR